MTSLLKNLPADSKRLLAATAVLVLGTVVAVLIITSLPPRKPANSHARGRAVVLASVLYAEINAGVPGGAISPGSAWLGPPPAGQFFFRDRTDHTAVTIDYVNAADASRIDGHLPPLAATVISTSDETAQQQQLELGFQMHMHRIPTPLGEAYVDLGGTFAVLPTATKLITVRTPSALALRPALLALKLTNADTPSTGHSRPAARRR